MPVSRTDLRAALETIAPLALAESWDNVGFLVDPAERGEFVHAFFTIDLSDETLEEATKAGADLLIAYHPPIFGGLKRLRRGEPGERVVVEAIRRDLTIYSPHTALDAVPGGMTDWLAGALGEGTSEPVVASQLVLGAGAGRLVRLARPVGLERAVERFKALLGLDRVRLGRGRSDEVRTFAVCPGAGGSVFEKVGDVDLLVTGEMRHHDVLARQVRGTSVILTDHTNSERAYLPIFAQRLARACPGLEVTVSSLDRDPLTIV